MSAASIISIASVLFLCAMAVDSFVQCVKRDKF